MPFPLLGLLAAGALGGAVLNKKDPLKGALLGAGLGATGGALFPALNAAGTGIVGAAGGTGAGLTGAAAGDAGLMYAGADAAAANTLGMGPGVSGGAGMKGLLGSVGKYAQPASQAMSLMQQDQQQVPQAAPVQQVGGGAQTLAQLAQQGGLLQDQLASMADKRRQRRGLFGVA